MMGDFNYMNDFSGDFYGYDQINGGPPITVTNPITQQNNLTPTNVDIDSQINRKVNERLLQVLNEQQKENILRNVEHNIIDSTYDIRKPDIVKTSPQYKKMTDSNENKEGFSSLNMARFGGCSSCKINNFLMYILIFIIIIQIAIYGVNVLIDYRLAKLKNTNSLMNPTQQIV